MSSGFTPSCPQDVIFCHVSELVFFTLFYFTSLLLDYYLKISNIFCEKRERGIINKLKTRMYFNRIWMESKVIYSATKGGIQ